MVSIAGATILGLIITLSIKERRKEIGILLSIGEKKWKLMGQLLVEVLCIAVLAFGLSLATGEKVSQKVGDNLLSSEIAKNEDKPEDPIAKLSGNPAADVDPVDNIHVSISTEDLGKVGDWIRNCYARNDSSGIIHSSFKSKTDFIKRRIRRIYMETILQFKISIIIMKVIIRELQS